ARRAGGVGARTRFRPRAAGGSVRRPAAARDRRRRGPGSRGRAVSRRARAGGGARSVRDLRAGGRIVARRAGDRRAGGGARGTGTLVVSTSVSLKGRDLLRIGDLSAAEATAVLDLATELRDDRDPRLEGRALGLIFGQPSTRTRISFAVAMIQLGGGFVTLTPDEMQLSRGESLHDTAHVLSRYLDALAIRVLSHEELEQWAAAAQIPVINALTSVEHPCQALADVLT